MVPAIRDRNNIHILGSGARTIVFAHGFGTDQTVWHQHVALFAKTNRIILFDHVGAGNSDLNAFDARRYNTLFSFANDLIEVCTEAASERITLVGHSVSGMIGLLASIAAPELSKN